MTNGQLRLLRPITAMANKTASLKSSFAVCGREYLHRGDLASGAIAPAIVERAKGKAIRRSISTQAETQITRDDLFQSINEEYSENDLSPPTDITEDWLKLTDFDSENVVKLSPIRPRKIAQEPSRII